MPHVYICRYIRHFNGGQVGTCTCSISYYHIISRHCTWDLRTKNWMHGIGIRFTLEPHYQEYWQCVPRKCMNWQYTCHCNLSHSIQNLP